jgi:peptidoglycan/xylan/chitin deacetylase (PgdA/CDA1 family)
MFPLARRLGWALIVIAALSLVTSCSAGAGAGAGAGGGPAKAQVTATTRPATTPPKPIPPKPIPPKPRPVRFGLGNANPGEVFHSVDTNEKVIALTFDDGPSKKGLAAILPALAKVRAHATFFEVGDRAIGHADLLRRIAASGNELANHTWDHQEVGKDASDAAIVASIRKTQSAFAAATGAPPVLFRPVAGHYDGRLPGIAADRGLAIALWSVHSGDTNGDSAAKITRTVLASAKPGAIVLMHETAPQSVLALSGILAGLKKRGYSMVTVSDLLGRGTPR